MRVKDPRSKVQNGAGWRRGVGPLRQFMTASEHKLYLAALKQLGRVVVGTEPPSEPLDRLIVAGGRGFTLPALWPRLAPHADQFSAETIELCRTVHTLNGERNAAILGDLERAAAALNEVGIVPCALKGAAHLMTGLWGSPANRVLSDIDLLVHPAELSRAVAALRDLLHASVHGDDKADAHHAPPMALPGAKAVIELHHSPVKLSLAGVVPTAEVFEQSRTVNLGNAMLRLPSATHSALVAAVHGPVAHGFFDLAPRDAIDLVYLAQDISDPVDWDFVAATLSGAGFGWVVEMVNVSAETLTDQAPPMAPVGKTARAIARGRLRLHRSAYAYRADYVLRRSAWHLRAIHTREGRAFTATTLRNPHFLSALGATLAPRRPSDEHRGKRNR